MVYKTTVFLIIFLLAIGCNKKLPSTQYVNWYKNSEENINMTKTEDFQYELRYISPEATALIEFEGDIDSLNKYKEDFKIFSNFNLKIFAKEKDKDVLKYKNNTENEYYERLQYFISYLNYDIKAIKYSKDTVPCIFHHYERTYNITPFANISLSFETDIKSIEKIIVKLPFDNKRAEIVINKTNYPELKL